MRVSETFGLKRTAIMMRCEEEDWLPRYGFSSRFRCPRAVPARLPTLLSMLFIFGWQSVNIAVAWCDLPCAFSTRENRVGCVIARFVVCCVCARLAHLLGVTALVGVVLDGSLAICLLDLSRVRALAHAEEVVKLVAVTLLRWRVVFLCGGEGGCEEILLAQEKRGGEVVLCCVVMSRAS